MARTLLVRTILCIVLLPLTVCSAAESSWGQSPDSWDADSNGRSYDEVKQSIFEREHKLIQIIGHYPMLMETYVQSLGFHSDVDMDKTRDRKREGLLDDLYYLSDVDFSNASYSAPRVRQIIGHHWRQQYVVTNNSMMERLPPEGPVYMFFPDVSDFNERSYTLRYHQKTVINDTTCWEFIVHPREGVRPVGFSGSIWVDQSTLAIVRVKGVDVSTEPWYKRAFEGRFFQFDSFRERDPWGNWLPSVTYFDERRTYIEDGDLRNDYRGYSILWRRGAAEQRPRSISDPGTEIGTAGVVEQLERDGVLAKVGPEEQMLNAIVQQLQRAAGVRGTLQCRILVTTPVEMFAVGRTIVVSRGLLNLVPDKAVLAVLIARSMASILQDNQRSKPILPHSIFDSAKRKDFAGLGIDSTTSEAATDKEMLLLLKGSGFESGVPETVEFLAGLQKGSRLFRNLVKPRFGSTIIPSREGFATLSAEPISPRPLSEIRLRDVFRIAADGSIRRNCSLCRSDNGSDEFSASVNRLTSPQ